MKHELMYNCPECDSIKTELVGGNGRKLFHSEAEGSRYLSSHPTQEWNCNSCSHIWLVCSSFNCKFGMSFKN